MDGDVDVDVCLLVDEYWTEDQYSHTDVGGDVDEEGYVDVDVGITVSAEGQSPVVPNGKYLTVVPRCFDSMEDWVSATTVLPIIVLGNFSSIGTVV